MQTRVTGLLKTEYPIIQGGMAWVADYHLAAAVSNGGGLGMIGAANAPAEWVADQRGQKTDGQTLWCQYHADEPPRR